MRPARGWPAPKRGVELGEEGRGLAGLEPDDAVAGTEAAGADVVEQARHGVELELRQGRGDMAGDEVLAIDEVLHQQGRRLLRAEAGLVQARPFGGADDMAVADGPFAGGA